MRGFSSSSKCLSYFSLFLLKTLRRRKKNTGRGGEGKWGEKNTVVGRCWLQCEKIVRIWWFFFNLNKVRDVFFSSFFAKVLDYARGKWAEVIRVVIAVIKREYEVGLYSNSLMRWVWKNSQNSTSNRVRKIPNFRSKKKLPSLDFIIFGAVLIFRWDA